MRAFILTLVFLAGTAVFAQEKEVVRTDKTVKISTYHDNGVLAQSGHQFKGKNHGDVAVDARLKPLQNGH